LQSFEKYQRAIELDPKYANAFRNWGSAISDLAKLKNDENLYPQSFKKYKKAIDLDSKQADTFYNWGSAISDLAKLKNDENLYLQSFEKYKKAIELDPKHASAFYNWGNAILGLAKLKNDDDLFKEAFHVCKQSEDLGGQCYNLACWYALRGTKIDALDKLEKSLAKKEITADFVEKDEDWMAFADDEDFIALLKKYR
jgi:tetratricopeptide (TPR) repeat protein